MSVAERFIDHLMTPGSSMKLLPAVNVCLVSLLGLLLYMADGVLPTVHLNIMGGLSLFLLGAVNWFIREFRKELLKQAAEGREAEDGSTETSPKKEQKSD